jgi:hypothetical protein
MNGLRNCPSRINVGAVVKKQLDEADVSTIDSLEQGRSLGLGVE